MAQERPGVVLMAPGVLSDLGHQHQGVSGRARHLTALLRRARQITAEASGYEAQLCAAFELEQSPGQDLPIARLGARVDLLQADSGYWLRADPVHLRPDQSRLVSLGNAGLDIAAEEANALTAALNAHFSEQGWRWFSPAPDRWYLQLPAKPAIATVPMVEAIGRNVDAHLPSGPDSRAWHAWLNEIQMLLYSHEVNQRRQEQRQPLINSVWWWGGGEARQQSLTTRFVRVWSDEVLAMGLAGAAGAQRSDRPVNGLEWLASGPEAGLHLLVLPDCYLPAAYQEPGDWLEALAGLERDWFAPLRRALAKGEIAALELWTGTDRSYRCMPADRWAFWRKRSIDDCFG